MKKNLILSFFISFIIIAIIVSPQKYIEVSMNAIIIWAKVLLPSLLPFFIFTKILTSLGYVKTFSTCFKNITYKLYKTPPISSYVFLMSILTGYPVGSKLTSDLYNNGFLSKQDAKKCITYTSNSGPMFIIGSVGIGMLLNKTAGYIILISHILGAILNGLLYRKISSNEPDKKINNNLQVQENSLSSCVMDSIYSILLIGGIMIVAFIIIEMLNSINIFSPINSVISKLGIESSITSSITNGLFEITRGCLETSTLNCSITLKTIISCFIISFGGFSTVLQAMAFLKNIVTYRFFVLQKTTHTIISTIICALLCFIVF